MPTKFLYIIIACLTAFAGSSGVVSAQKTNIKGYKVVLNIDSLPQKWIKMGYYYGKNAYLIDSQLVVKTQKSYVFKGDKKLPEGMYFFVFDDGTMLEFMMDKPQNFAISTQFTYLRDSIFVENSTENEQYFEYLRYLAPQERKIIDVNISVANAKANKNDQLVQLLEPKKQRIINEINTYIKAYIQAYPNNLQSKIMIAGKNIVVPDSIPYVIDKKMNYFYYKYIYDHYWDSYDMTDVRLLHTKAFDKKMTNYFDQIIPKNPDSTIVCINKRIKSVEKYDAKVQNETVLWLANHYDKIDVMGYDAIYIYIAKNHLTPEKAGWLSAADRERLNYKVKMYENTLLGNTVPDINLVDVTNQAFDLKTVAADYTFVLFYSTKCTHCIEQMPKFYELYQKYKDKNVAMVAINIDKDDRKDWGKFVQSQGWTWYNATPADTEKQFQETFAAYNLPVSYMLNADKKIVMKRLQPDQFDKHLAKMIE